MDKEELKTLVTSLVGEFFEQFKVNAMQEMKKMFSSISREGHKEKEVRRMESPQEVGGSTSETISGSKVMNVEDQFVSETVAEEENSEEVILVDNANEETEVAEDEDKGEKTRDGDVQVENSEGNMELVLEDDSSLRKNLFSDSDDPTLVKLMSSVGGENHMSAAFLASSLRARLATVTLLEIYESSNNGGEDDSPFRVLEAKDGTLTVAHESSVNQSAWSNQVTIDHGDSTLEEEVKSVRQNDIVKLSQQGPRLSPMTVEDVNLHKKTFRTATIVSKGRKVKVLFKRKDK